jgi:TPR repeat protein
MRMNFKFGPIGGVAVVLLSAMSFSAPAADAKTPREITIEGIESYNNGIFNLAFRLLKTAADLGDSDAQVNLGYMYARGQGTKADQAEAMRLYRLSADSGNGEGMNAIAYKYTYGTGVPIDMKMAVRWYCRAIAQGNPRALNNLGLLHAQGVGIAFDMDEALDLWRQSAELGHANAMLNLGLALLQMPGAPQKQAEGKAWVVRAAQLGQPDAIGWLKSNGYDGSLPQPINTTGQMALAPPKAEAGNAKECATS